MRSFTLRFLVRIADPADDGQDASCLDDGHLIGVVASGKIGKGVQHFNSALWRAAVEEADKALRDC